MERYDGSIRSHVLDAWDYQAPFAPFHVRWLEGDLTPTIGQEQAYALALQELELDREMKIMAHRESFVTFSSEHVMVGRGPAEREPAWVVMIAGHKLEDESTAAGTLARIRPGGGAVVQLLIHARTGEILLGVSIPVRLRVGQ